MGFPFEDNIKNTRPDDKEGRRLVCKCGSIRIGADLRRDDQGEWNWVEIYCRACGNILYAHGA